MVSPAPLVAVYTTVPGGTMLVAVEPILMTLPPSGPNCAPASFVASSIPNTLVAKWREDSHAVAPGFPENFLTPPALDRTARRRKSFFGSPDIRLPPAGLDR